MSFSYEILEWGFKHYENKILNLKMGEVMEKKIDIFRRIGSCVACHSNTFIILAGFLFSPE